MSQHLGTASGIKVCSAVFAGQVGEMETVVVLAPAQGLAALVDMAQLALALGLGGWLVAVCRKAATGSSCHGV